MISRIKDFVEEYADEFFLVTVLLLVAVVSFGAGRLSVSSPSSGELLIKSTPIETDQLVQIVEQPPAAEEGSSEPTQIVGNKKSKIYHRTDCSGAQRLAEENKIYFASIVAAKDAGYRPAGNCPGLE